MWIMYLNDYGNKTYILHVLKQMESSLEIESQKEHFDIFSYYKRINWSSSYLFSIRLCYVSCHLSSN